MFGTKHSWTKNRTVTERNHLSLPPQLMAEEKECSVYIWGNKLWYWYLTAAVSNSFKTKLRTMEICFNVHGVLYPSFLKYKLINENTIDYSPVIRITIPVPWQRDDVCVV